MFMAEEMYTKGKGLWGWQSGELTINILEFYKKIVSVLGLKLQVQKCLGIS